MVDTLSYLCRMEQLLRQLEEYKKEIIAFSEADEKTVEEFRIKWLGTKGIVKEVMSEMKNVPNEKKKEFGQILNEFKSFTEAKYEELKSSTSNILPIAIGTTSNLDLTLPDRKSVV